MVCEWTGLYTYQPNTPQSKRGDYDRVCDAIISYVGEYGNKHNLKIVTTTDNRSWYRHGRPIEIICYHLQNENRIMPIEEVAANIIMWYECALDDEITNFGENGVYIGEPWSAEDLEVFTRECMKEGIIYE